MKCNKASVRLRGATLGPYRFQVAGVALEKFHLAANAFQAHVGQATRLVRHQLAFIREHVADAALVGQLYAGLDLLKNY